MVVDVDVDGAVDLDATLDLDDPVDDGGAHVHGAAWVNDHVNGHDNEHGSRRAERAVTRRGSAWAGRRRRERQPVPGDAHVDGGEASGGQRPSQPRR